MGTRKIFKVKDPENIVFTLQYQARLKDFIRLSELISLANSEEFIKSDFMNAIRGMVEFARKEFTVNHEVEEDK